MSTPRPRRRVVLKLDLQADTRERLIEELKDITRRVSDGTMWGHCVMGGHSAGYLMDATEDESITHDSYFEALEAMLAPKTPPAAPVASV